MSQVVTLTHSTLHRAIKHSPVPVLVDYWAPRCRPRPVLEQIAAERAIGLDDVTPAAAA